MRHFSIYMDKTRTAAENRGAFRILIYACATMRRQCKSELEKGFFVLPFTIKAQDSYTVTSSSELGSILPVTLCGQVEIKGCTDILLVKLTLAINEKNV